MVNLEKTRVLDKDEVRVRDCFAIEQDPMLGSKTQQGKLLYPDMPVRADYIGLVKTSNDERIIDLMKGGKPLNSSNLSAPRADRSKRLVEWQLHLDGRDDTVRVVLNLVAKPLHAHWMIGLDFALSLESGALIMSTNTVPTAK